MARHRRPYNQTFSIGLLLLWPRWELLIRSFPVWTLSVHAGRLFELVVISFRLIVLVRRSNGTNYYLTARADIRLLSRIWSLASLMRNICVPSYYQPPSSWRERILGISLTLCYQPLRAAGNSCSSGCRCWSIHTLHTRRISQTWALWILSNWGAAVLWRQTHVMGRGIFDVLLLRKFMRLGKVFAKTTMKTSLF